MLLWSVLWLYTVWIFMVHKWPCRPFYQVLCQNFIILTCVLHKMIIKFSTKFPWEPHMWLCSPRLYKSTLFFTNLQTTSFQPFMWVKSKTPSHFSENKLDPNQPFVVFGNFTVFVPAFWDDGSQMCWLLHRCDGIATNLQYDHTCILVLVVKTLSRHIIEASLNNYNSVEWSVFPWNWNTWRWRLSSFFPFYWFTERSHSLFILTITVDLVVSPLHHMHCYLEENFLKAHQLRKVNTFPCWWSEWMFVFLQYTAAHKYKFLTSQLVRFQPLQLLKGHHH